MGMHRTREARIFYASSEWQRTREAYIISRHGICEECGGPGVIVHHRKHLNSDNTKHWDTTCNADNLKLVCIECHNTEHAGGPRNKREGADWRKYMR
jgi:5-methylcytosine-specific restriction endonuclease McrA